MAFAEPLRLNKRVSRKSGVSGDSDFSIRYTDLEGILAALFGTTRQRIRTRFRKLRVRSFPDDISHGTGVRIRYDLNRSLAIAAAFELNALGLPQGTAAAIVEASWPEWCRAFLAAAVELKIMARPAQMPFGAGTTLQIGGGMLAEEGDAILDVRVISSLNVDELAQRPVIAIDLRRIARALLDPAARAGGANLGALAWQAGTMERIFGWTVPEIPFRGSVQDMWREPSFLDDGPFLTRAQRLLEGLPEEDGRQVDSRLRPRLQALLDYLEDPSPVDVWKREVGEDEALPRLKHLIADASRKAGLDPRCESLRSPHMNGSRAKALRMIERINENRAEHAPNRQLGRDASVKVHGV